MATLKITMSLAGFSSTQLKNFETSNEISEVLDRLKGLSVQSQASSGTATSVTLTSVENGVRASGTVTCVTVANNSTVTVGNVVLTGKTGSPSGQAEWKCGVSAGADAIALAACINAHTTVSTWVSCPTPVAGAVTIRALDYDTRGNAYALTSSDGTNLAVVGFTGGALDTSSATFNA